MKDHRQEDSLGIQRACLNNMLISSGIALGAERMIACSAGIISVITTT